jgi:hypothetical protein
MAHQKFEFSKNQRFLRGLVFIATGVFLLLRFAARNDSAFFLAAAWFAALVALGALLIFLWSIYARS